MMMETLQKKQLIDTIATRACSPLERLQKISEGENDIGEQGGRHNCNVSIRWSMR